MTPTWSFLEPHGQTWSPEGGHVVIVDTSMKNTLIWRTWSLGQTAHLEAH